MKLFTYKLFLGLLDRRYIKYNNKVLCCYNFNDEEYEFYKVSNKILRLVRTEKNKDKAMFLLNILSNKRG